VNLKNKKTYFVTGGLGFIGSNFVHLCLSKKFKVINIDKCSYASNIKNNKIFSKYKNYNFFKASIGNKKKMNELLFKYKPNYIINFAAETHVDNSITSPVRFIKNNISDYAYFLDCIKKYYAKLNIYKKKKIRIVHISTDEVYGSLNFKDKSFSEKNKFFPNSPYSASKASSDLISRAWYKTFDLPIIVTNCSNNYGMYQNKEKFIPKIIINILKRKRIPVYAEGKNIREWLHVSDHCSAIIHLIKYGKIGETYNIGSPYNCSNIFLVKKICKMVDKKLGKKNFSQKLIAFIPDRKAHDLKYSVDYSKLRKLNWKPKMNFDEGLNDTIDWYIKNYYE